MNSVAIRHDYVLELLEDITQQTPQTPTDLIICSSKEDFVSHLLAELHRYHLEHEPLITAPEGGSDERDASTALGPNHILLSKTLHVLNASQYVKLIFCPTITVLRGHLSGYLPCMTNPSQPLGPIVILDLIAMHHG